MTFLDVNRFHSHILIDFLHFIILWFRFKISKYNTIHYKLTVIGDISEISSIGQITLTGFLVIIIHRLIHPIPNGTATEEISRFDSFPVVDQISTGIPHGMGIFRDMERIFNIIISFYSSPYPTDRRILVGTHIHNRIVPFVLYRTG